MGRAGRTQYCDVYVTFAPQGCANSVTLMHY